MRSLLALAAAICLAGLARGLDAAPARVTLNEGTQLAVSSDRQGSQIAFKLAGRIWLARTADGNAQAVTPLIEQDDRPALSPDGRLLAFERRIGRQHHIMLMPSKGGDARQLTFGPFDHHAPSWHPDGERLLMASDRGGDFGIWEIDVATLGLRQVSSLPGEERDPVYNHKGDRVAFVHAAASGDRLVIREADGSLRNVLETTAELFAPAWRPDDSLLSYVERDTGRSEMRMAILSQPPVSKALTQGENVFPAAAHWLSRDELLYAADGRIRRRNFDAFSAHDLPFSAVVAIDATPRPPALEEADAEDESRLVRSITGAVAATDGLFISAQGDLWELDRDGVARRQFTNDAFTDDQLIGNPANQLLAFASDRGGSQQIWLLDPADGSMQAVTTETGPAFAPAWRADGRAIAYLAADHTAAASARLKVLFLDQQQDDRRTARLGTVPRGTGTPSWIGDDRVAVASGAGQSALLAFDLGNPLPWTLPLPLPAGARVSAAQFSPDGSQLALLADSQLFLVGRNAEGFDDQPRRVAREASLPRWNPVDGSLLYQDHAGRLMRLDPASGDTRELTIRLRWRPRSAGRPLLVRAGRLFDGLGPGYQLRRNILIRDGRIETITGWSDPPPADAEIIDARELVVLPGLIDTAARDGWPDGSRAGRSWLAWGVTSIRQWTDDLDATRARRERWHSGKQPGPRLHTGLALCAPDLARAGRRLAQARRFAANSIELCVATPGDQLAEIAAFASRAGLGVATAAPFPGALLGASEISLTGRRELLDAYPGGFDRFAYADLTDLAGAGGLTVVSRLSPAGLPGLVQRSESLLQAPAFSGLNTEADRYWYEESWRRQRAIAGTALRAEQRTAVQSAFRAVGRGARLVIGSNAPDTPRGMSLHAEMRLLAESGLQPFQVLGMASLEAARALGLEQELGRVAPGLRADLVLVRGDPLADVSDAAAVVASIVDGRIYRFEDLVPGRSVGNFYTTDGSSTGKP